MNQLRLNFETEYPQLPRELDRLMVSFLKASIQKYSPELFEVLFDKSKSIMKGYTFSFLLPGARFEADVIHLSQNSFTMFFSDADMGEFIYFFNAFKMMKAKSYPMNGNSMKLVSMSLQNLPKIADTEIVVKMQSSLVVRRHDSETNKDVYYTYDQEGFCEALHENVKFLVEKLELPVSTEDFFITPIKGKKVVVPIFGRNADANVGIFKLCGSPELLNVLQLAGIGARRSEGHGKFEVLL